MAEDDDDLLTEREAAELLKVSPQTVEGWRHAGTGPPFARIGRSPRYLRRNVRAWVEQRREGDTKPSSRTRRRRS
jgi:excisionase family DNA binding protein